MKKMKLLLLLLLFILTACQHHSSLQGHYLNGNSDLYGHSDVRIFYYNSDNKHILIDNSNPHRYAPNKRPQLVDYYFPGVYTINDIVEENDTYTLKLEMFDEVTGESLKKVDYHFKKQADKWVDDHQVEFELRKIIEH